MSEIQKHYKRQGAAYRFFRRTFTGEKMNVGAYMWAAQRVSGLILSLYLLLHLYTLSAVWGGPDAFDHAMNMLDHPVIKFLEVILLGTAFFHAFNGVRLILITLFVNINQRVLAFSLSTATLIFMIISIPFIY